MLIVLVVFIEVHLYFCLGQFFDLRCLFLLLIDLEPLVLKSLHSADSVIRMLLQHLRAQILGLRTQILPQLFREIDFALLVLPQDLIIVLCIEDELGSKQNVHDDSQTKDIHLAPISKVIEDLGGNVAWGATSRKLWSILTGGG